MNCNDIEIMISAYADNELDKHDMAVVDAHIQACESCRRIFSETIHLQRNLTDALMPFPVSPDLVCAIDARILARRAYRFAWAYAAAAVVLLGACAYGFLQQAPIARTINPAVVADHANKPAPLPAKTAIKPAPIVHAPKSAPRRFAAAAVKKYKPNHLSKIPAKEPIQVASEDQVEVIIKYTESTPSSSAIAEISPPMPIAAPGKRVVAESDFYTVNGKRVQRVCYKIVDINPKEP